MAREGFAGGVVWRGSRGFARGPDARRRGLAVGLDGRAGSARAEKDVRVIGKQAPRTSRSRRYTLRRSCTAVPLTVVSRPRDARHAHHDLLAQGRLHRHLPPQREFCQMVARLRSVQLFSCGVKSRWAAGIRWSMVRVLAIS